MGETLSSGTGASGAAVAAVPRGRAEPDHGRARRRRAEVEVSRRARRDADRLRPSRSTRASCRPSWSARWPRSRRLSRWPTPRSASAHRPSPRSGSRRCRRTCSPSSSARSPTSGRPGIDVISLGIGDPDHPTYPHIVEAMQAAVADPGTHQYPSNRGRDGVPRGVRELLRAPLRGRDRPRDRGDPGDRRQGVHLQPLLRLPRPRRRRARLRPRLPRLHRRPAARRRRGGAAAAACPSSASRPTSTRSPPRRLRARAADVPQLPQQPDRRDRARRLLRAGRRARARARDPRRPRQRLLGDDLRRLRRAELPRHARRQGGRRRGLLALEGLQHDRLALRGDPRQRRGDPDLLAPEDERRLGPVRGGAARRRRGARGPARADRAR